MSQYDPLNKWLRANPRQRIPITFNEIEDILGFDLPSTARERPQWWANEKGESRHVQCQAWLEAGFETKNVNIGKETLEFVRKSYRYVVGSPSGPPSGKH